MSTSVLSFPDRGKWGSSKWRGNCSGHIYKALFDQYRPASFCDPMMDSGTSIEVAKEMGIEAYGLDLHQGFNALKDSIQARIGKQVDFCHSHPPYGEMILYSGEVWGSQGHSDDLSRCVDDNDFHEKLHLVLMNQRDATVPGGYYGTLIGDLRSNGRYVSYQAECIARMPASELASVIIKHQHNCVSDARQYSKMKHFRIMHEYLILWQKPLSPVSLLMDLSKLASASSERLKSVWRVIVKLALQKLGGKSTLPDLYAAIAKQAPDRLVSNPNWQAKVRQTLQLDPEFKRLDRGVWAFTC